MDSKPQSWRTNSTFLRHRTCSVAEAFTSAFGPTAPLGHRCTPWPVFITVPQTPSTGGGTRAVQLICAIPPEGTLFVIGALSHKRGEAHLRSYESLEASFPRHWSEEDPLDAESYRRLLARLREFLFFHGFRVRFFPAPDVPPQPQPTRTRRRSFDRRTIVRGAALVGALWLLGAASDIGLLLSFGLACVLAAVTTGAARLFDLLASAS